MKGNIIINSGIQRFKTRAVSIPIVESQLYKNDNLQQLLVSCKAISNDMAKRELQEIIIFCTVCGNSSHVSQEYYVKIQQDLQQINRNFSFNDAKTLITIANTRTSDEYKNNNFSKKMLEFLTQISIIPNHDKLSKLNIIMFKGLDPKFEYTKEQIKYFSDIVYLKAKYNSNRLEDITLNGYDFSAKDFSDFTFSDINITNINFTNSILMDAHFYRARLYDVKFINIDLSNTTFVEVSFHNTLIVDVNLENLSLYHCRFFNTEIVNSNFHNIQTGDCNFSGVAFNLKTYNIKVNNYQNKSELIRTLSTIQNELIKNNLIQQVIDHVINYANNQAWCMASKNDNELFVIYLEDMSIHDLEEFMIKNNNFINQLVHHARFIGETLISRANKLYKIFLELPECKSVIKKYADDCAMTFEESLNHHSTSSLFFIKNHTILIANNKYMNQCLYDQKVNNEITDWYGMLYYDGNKLINSERLNLEILFNTHSLFEYSYSTKSLNIKLFKFLEALNLGPYLELFKTKAHQKITSSKESLSSDANKAALWEIFNKFFTNNEPNKNLTITDEHLTIIFKQFNMNYRPVELLIVVATIMTYYGSENVFGNRSDAPEALRFYAYGLIKAAYKIHPNIFTISNRNYFIELENRFLGIEEPCMHVLAKFLWELCHLKCADYADEIILQAWGKM